MSSQAASTLKKFSTAPVDTRSGDSFQATKTLADINTMKDGSQSTTKPNAWSKPLQGAAPSKAKGINISGSSGNSNKGTRSAAPPPGYVSKPSAHSSAIEKSLPALRERFLHLLLALTGQKVTVSLASGVSYTGILHTATPFPHLPSEQRNKYVLRAVTVAGVNGEVPMVKPGSTVLLDMDEVVQLQCKACRLDSLVPNTTMKTGDTFTDTEISRGTKVSQARKDFVAVDATWTSAGDKSTLQPLTPINSKAAKLAGLSPIPTNGVLKGSIEGWDQFKANEELFNVVGSYDETVYTTVLDHSQISAHERQRAEKLAREIENTTTTNIHLAEERGQVAAADLADYDEEDRYSGVLKSVSKPRLNYAQAVASVTSSVTAEATSVNDDENHKVDTEEPKQVIIIKNDVTSKESDTIDDFSLEQIVDSMEAIHLAEKEAEVSIATATESKGTEVKSKLNAAAKEFSFNVNAKSFQPTPLPPPPPPIPPPQYVYDPVTGMPVMIQPHMVPGGMMPHMMNSAQYPGMRYPGQYPGMEFSQPAMSHMHSMHPPQHARPPTTLTPSSISATSAPEDSPTPVSEEDSIARSEQNQPADISDTNPVIDPQQPPGGNGQSPQRPRQPPPVTTGHPLPHAMSIQHHMYYPGGFYNPAMGMFPPQQGGAPHQYGPTHVSAHIPRQMYNGPGMPAGGMPPNMMRGPPAYYSGPNGPVPYPHYSVGGGAYGGAEDETMGYGGRGRVGRGAGRVGRNPGRGQGRGTGGGRSGGRGRYNHQYSGGSGSLGDSGRDTPQGSAATPPPTQSALSSDPDTATAGTAGGAASSFLVASSSNVSEVAPAADANLTAVANSNAGNGK